MVLQWQTDNRREVTFSLQSTKAWPANTNATGLTESLDKLYFFQWFCIFSKTLSTLFDALSCLEICDITSNSVGYQNTFRVEFNPMVNNMPFSNSSLHVPVPICMGDCKCTWWILANAGNLLQRPWAHDLPVGMKFKMLSLPCKVSYNSCTVDHQCISPCIVNGFESISEISSLLRCFLHCFNNLILCLIRVQVEDDAGIISVLN